MNALGNINKTKLLMLLLQSGLYKAVQSKSWSIKQHHYKLGVVVVCGRRLGDPGTSGLPRLIMQAEPWTTLRSVTKWPTQNNATRREGLLLACICKLVGYIVRDKKETQGFSGYARRCLPRALSLFRARLIRNNALVRAKDGRLMCCPCLCTVTTVSVH